MNNSKEGKLNDEQSLGETLYDLTEQGSSSNVTGKRAYTRPSILSREVLEAAAATCNPPTAALGKAVPVPCGILGS